MRQRPPESPGVVDAYGHLQRWPHPPASLLQHKSVRIGWFKTHTHCNKQLFYFWAQGTLGYTKMNIRSARVSALGTSTVTKLWLWQFRGLMQPHSSFTGGDVSRRRKFDCFILSESCTGRALRYARAGQLQLFKNGRLLCFCTGCKHLIFVFVAHMFYLRPGGSVRISSARYICYCPLDFICFCREVFHMFLPQQPTIF